jgi:hypothetical protein
MTTASPVEATLETPPKKKKASSVRHTRAIQRDRSKRPTVAPPDDQVAERLTEIVHPATLAQLDYYRQLGLRERILTLPVMVALVLSLIWRQIGGVCELVRLARSEHLLWLPPFHVTQQALSERLSTFPAELFLRILTAVLPLMQQRWSARQRPRPPEIAWAQARYPQVWVVDGSTLDALIRKVGLLREALVHPLAGRMMALLELGSRLPRQIWYTPDPDTHDQGFWPDILAALQAGALLIFDLGYTNFQVFVQLSLAQVTFLTRAKRNLAYQVIRTFQQTAQVHDRLVWIGKDATRQQVRLIEVVYRGTWYRYLTNELDPLVLPAEYVVALYWQRWRIEDAYAIVKRLLGLAYFWTGSENGVCLQLWATWLLYAVLVDLTDAVADALNQPFAALSLEMVYRSLYHFTQAYHRGEATEVVQYLAANAKWLGILKRKRKRQTKPALLNPLPLTALSEP